MKTFLKCVAGMTVAAISGCGGDSSGKGPTGIAINDSLKGPESRPELTTVTSGTVYLNSLITSDIVDDGVEYWNFQSSSNESVILVLRSEAEDLDLTLSGNTVFDSSSGFDSNEMIIFDAEIDEGYSITVDSFTGAGSYELEVASLNRESAGLETDEYLVSFNIDFESECDSGTYSRSYEYLETLNWSAGYIGRGEEREYYDSVDGATLTFSFSYSESEPDYSYTSSGSLTIIVDPQTGDFTGVASGLTSEDYDGDIDNCTYNESIEGSIVI